jgi:hypothetical protein
MSIKTTIRRALFLSLAILSGNLLGAKKESNLLANGSFEHWTSVSDVYLKGKKFEGDHPKVPKRWDFSTAVVASEDAHSGKCAASAGAGARLSMRYVELNPGSTFSYGVWIKGKGKIRVGLDGVAFEGMHKLSEAEAEASENWTEVRGEIKVPGHVRLVEFWIQMPPQSRHLLVDDAFISVKLAEHFNADDILSNKYTRDDKCVFYEDFDGTNPIISFPTKNGKSAIADDAGRFGKGLRMFATEIATLPISADTMPKEGTLEFWVSPDEFPRKTLLGLGSSNGNLFEIASNFNFVWENRKPKSNGWISIPYPHDHIGSRPGTWTHVAVTWDSSAIRIYLDGVIAVLHTGNMPIWRAPVMVKIGADYSTGCWNGKMDEIRFSNVKRYGPFVPEGDTFTPFPEFKKLEPEQDASAEVAKEVLPDPKEEAKRMSSERSKLIAPLKSGMDGRYENAPNDKGEYLYEASSAKPLVASGHLEIMKDKPAKDMTLAAYTPCRLIFRSADTEGLYWKLGKIKSGKYWIAVQNNSDPFRILAIFHNGRVIQATRSTDPIQVAPELYIIEAQVDEPLELREGDEIAVQCQNGKNPVVGALCLRPQKPEPGKHPLATNLGGDGWSMYSALGIAAETVFCGKDGKELPTLSDRFLDQKAPLPAHFERGLDGRPLATVRILNPLPVPVTLDYSCEILSYYRCPVGGEKEKLTVQPHETLVRKVPFKIIPDEPSYSALVRVLAVDPPELGWPEGDEISDFQGLRHSVAWPNPWKDIYLRRVTFTEPVEGPRQTLSLGGTWEGAFTKSIDVVFPVPEGLAFKNARVPGGMKAESENDHGLYLRRKVVLPPEAAGKACKIEVVANGLTCAGQAATAWVNGQEIGNVRGGNTPFSADATKAIKTGENEIVFLLRDLVALMNPDYVNREAPVADLKYLDVPGGVDLGIGNVELIMSPLISAEELLALPSFRKKTLNARFSIVNRRNAPATVKVKTHVLDRGTSVLVLDEREMALSSGKKEDISVEKRWENPELWGPSNPYLYVLAVEIVDPKTGERIDMARERFGFRESWLEGPNLMLNGIPVRPKGIFSPKDFDLVTMTRGTQGRTEWYDEMGRMGGMMTTFLLNSSSRHNVERDQYWEAAKRNALANVKKYGNHPSIIAWDISNEWLCFTDHYAPDPMLPGKRFKDVSDHLRNFDPSRWTLGNAEGDFMGLLDNFSGHYLYPARGAESALGHNLCLPDNMYWRPLDRHFTKGEEIRESYLSKNIFRPDQKVIMNNEFLWKNGWHMYPGISELCGENIFLGMAVDSYSATASWFWRLMLDGNRDLGVAPIQHFNQPGADARGSLPRSFLMPDVAHNGFSKRPFVRLYKIFNNEMSSAKMELRWELADSTGKLSERKTESVEMVPRQVFEGKIEFILPDVATRSRFAFKTRLYADGKFMTGQELDIDVFPDLPVDLGATEREVFLYDPKGNTAHIFDLAKIKHEKCADLAAPPDSEGNALIIVGEDALETDSAAKCLNLEPFASRGGRVVFLHQKIIPAGLPVSTKLDPSHWASISFNRMPSHPVMDGITDWDLSFWSNDRVVSRGCYSKPEKGTFVTLVDSGYQKRGLEFVQMMEIFTGRGSFVLCQLPLMEKYDQEPMAREMLSRILHYAAGDKPFVQPVTTLQAMVRNNGAIHKALEGKEVKYRLADLDSPLKGDEPILVEAEVMRNASEPQRETIAGVLKDGAKFVVSRPAPADAEWISKLAGTPVAITVQPYRNWHGRAMRTGYSPFTAGLSHQDLYWKRIDGGDQGRGQVDIPEYAFEAIQDYSVRADKARELAYPGALLELTVGKGTLLIDSRRWMTANADLAKHTARNLSALMLGLGVEIAPAIHIRQLPKELDYRAVDLTQFANRSLIDEKGQDGEGGWNDQGAGNDLKSFKTGKLNFQGIPFFVGENPKSCIVLRNVKRLFPEKYPAEVSMPIGYNVEGFYFLHGFAYCGGTRPVSTFQVLYDDGSTYDVKVIGDVNARDWIMGPSGFPNEKDTSSSVAWTGSCEKFPVVAVYKMLWVNPKPEIPVKGIRYFKTAEMGAVHALMGLTSVLKRESKVLSADELAHVADLMGKGALAARKKENDTAETFFRQAIAIDPKQWDAYQQLADILEQKKHDEELLDHYHLWVRNGAISPFPYNRIGQLLEKKNDLRGAIEFYARSLQVEWNQPPIQEAKSRLEQAVNK